MDKMQIRKLISNEAEIAGGALTVMMPQGGARVGGKATKGVRHCVKNKMVYSPALGERVTRCAKYAMDEPRVIYVEEPRRVARSRATARVMPESRTRGSARPSKGIRHCVEDQIVYSDALSEPVVRCKKYSRGRGLVGGCGECPACGFDMGGAMVGGNINNKRAAARSPWIRYVKEFQSAHPGMTYQEALEQAKYSYRRMQ